jgi:glycosyltransferase involved in cell wall biosynthesis
LVVSTEDQAARLCGWGIQNVAVVRPGIDTARFSYTPLSPGAPPTLLMGSAPWTRQQFHSKGVLALLELALQMSELRLVFLWRGVLADEMARRVQSAGLEARVEVLNERVDVNEVLARVHAAVVLAAGDALIKAYPHSLLEALVAGRPVLVSRSIPMARYVEQEGCGVVVERADATAIRVALETLLADHQGYQQRALSVGGRDFSLDKTLADYDRVYDTVHC